MKIRLGGTVRRKNSVRFGELALEQIKRFGPSAEPPAYEVWYHHVAGNNPALKLSVDEIIARNGKLSAAEVDHLRELHLHPNTADRIRKIGGKIADEVDQVVGMIEASIGDTDRFDVSLAESNQQLGHPIDRQTLRAIIEAVLTAVQDMQQENRKLAVNLKETRADLSNLQESLNSVRIESLTDPLTGLANRRHFDDFLRSAIVEAERTDAPLSLLIADVDKFKNFNDAYGHQIGDNVLRLIATTMRRSLKGQDFIARFGGEEFVVVLLGTALREAIIVANNIRNAVAAHELVKRPSGESLGRITISVGVASLRSDMNAQSLFDLADACLYSAKTNGRNRVVCENDVQLSNETVEPLRPDTRR